MDDSSGSRVPTVGGRLAGQVYARLKEELLRGDHPAGEPLNVVALRERFAVSKQPVMEALRALAGERLVEIQPQVGVRVSLFGAEEVRGFFEVFASAEGAMARRAATRRTEAQLGELAGLCHWLESVETSPDAELVYARNNRRIHQIVHAMAGSSLASDVCAGLWDLSDFLIATHSQGPDIALESRNHGHREVLDALTARDEDGAERAMVEHVLHAPGIPAVHA